jgi:hypothetical protein
MSEEGTLAREASAAVGCANRDAGVAKAAGRAALAGVPGVAGVAGVGAGVAAAPLAAAAAAREVCGVPVSGPVGRSMAFSCAEVDDPARLGAQPMCV